MNQLHDDDERFETVIDHDGQPRRVLRNGASLRVPLWAMDSLQRSVYAATHDANDLERLRTLRNEAARERNHRDENAWRGDASKTCPNCGFDLSKGYTTRAGGGETDDGANPHSARFDLDAARAVRARLYEDLANEQANAWKRGKA